MQRPSRHASPRAAERRPRPWRLLGLAASFLLFAIPAGDLFAETAIRFCKPPTGEPLPPELREAMRQPAADDIPWGWRDYARRVRANRKAVEEGRLSPEKAEQSGGVAITGTKGFPVIPMLWANTPGAPYSSSDLEDQLFTGPWPTGTLKEYYEEVSYGVFSVTGVVSEWIALSEDDTYYEGSGNGSIPGSDHLDEALLEAMAGADGAIDFSQFDNDGPDGMPNTADDDGYVDFIMFLHPESGGECSPASDNVWSHKGSLSYWGALSYESDDPSNSPGTPFTRINDYFVSAGLGCFGGQAGIGTPCHEFGHALDIKDLYDVEYESDGLGEWCLMAAGSWNTQDSPAHMSAWVKERLGWLSYFYVTSDLEHLCLPPVETHRSAVRLWANGSVGAEYFLVENRQKIGFDSELSSPGLVIYHIDEDVYDDNEFWNEVNADETHKAIDIECADALLAGHVLNADDLDIYGDLNRGDAGDVWCTATQTEFSPVSTPDTRAYNDNPTGVYVGGIGDCDGDAGEQPGWICADFLIGTPQTVNLCMNDCAGDNCAEFTNCDYFWGSPALWIDNDEDGDHDLPAPGIENKLWYKVKNVGPNTASNATVDLYWADPALGQLWPSTGNLIEKAPVSALAPGDSAVGYVVFEYPVTPEFVDHYCIGSIAAHPADAQNSEWAPNDNNVAQVNHQVLVERAGGGKTLAGCPGPFAKRSKLTLYPGPFQDQIQAILLVGSPPNYSDAYIPAGWNFSYDPGPHLLTPAGIETYVSMSADNADHGDSAWVPLTLVIDNIPIGGTILEYKIDCFEPLAPEHASGDCLPPQGDDLAGPTVLLEWDPVEFDVNGNKEDVKHYEVWRADNQGNPVMTLIDEVAIDAAPAAPKFQWHDTVFFDSGYVYSYRVRALDGTDNPSAFSPVVEIDCDLIQTAVAEDAPIAPGRLTEARPNPFNPSTTIYFRVPEAGDVRLAIYDPAGRLVRTLVEGEHAAGLHEAVWNGEADRGESVASGVYFYRYRANGAEETRKIVLAR